MLDIYINTTTSIHATGLPPYRLQRDMIEIFAAIAAASVNMPSPAIIGDTSCLQHFDYLFRSLQAATRLFSGNTADGSTLKLAHSAQPRQQLTLLTAGFDTTRYNNSIFNGPSRIIITISATAIAIAGENSVLGHFDTAQMKMWLRSHICRWFRFSKQASNRLSLLRNWPLPLPALPAK